MANSRKKIVESSAGGHIDVAYGIYDRPGPDITNEPLPDFEPIVPKEQVDCRLLHNISTYGQAMFYQRSGYDLKFRLKNYDSTSGNVIVQVFAETAPWRHGDASSSMGQFNLSKDDSKPIKHAYFY